jgi:cell division protein FtsW
MFSPSSLNIELKNQSKLPLPPDNPFGMLQPSIYRLRLQDILTICVLGLLCLGILMVQSAAMNITEQTTQWHWTDRGAKHLLYVAIALLTFFAIGHLNFEKLAARKSQIAIASLAVALLTCILVLLPHIGTSVKGARRWLPLGFTQVQPSELAKWAVVIFLSACLSSENRISPFENRKLLPLLLILAPIGAICLLVVIEDFGTAFLIALCALTILLVARIKLWHIALLAPPAIAAGVWFITHKSYRMTRMMSFRDPFANPQHEGYHMIQSLLSFSTGGLFGTGLGRGVQKLGYLPEDTTDFIFAVICEELGLFGALLVIALYLGILYVAWQSIRSMVLTNSKPNSFPLLLTFGIASMICLQALINIAVATVSVPPKGMSLPLVSAGGSGLVITSAALGLLYSICRTKAHGLPSVRPEELPDIGKPSLAM